MIDDPAEEPTLISDVAQTMIMVGTIDMREAFATMMSMINVQGSATGRGVGLRSETPEFKGGIPTSRIMTGVNLIQIEPTRAIEDSLQNSQ